MKLILMKYIKTQNNKTMNDNFNLKKFLKEGKLLKEEQFNPNEYYGEITEPLDLFNKLEESIEELRMSISMADGEGGIVDIDEAMDALDEAISSLEKTQRYFYRGVALTGDYYKKSSKTTNPPPHPTPAYPQK